MLGRILSRVDILGSQINLNVTEANKVRSGFGGFLSLAFVGFMLWFLYYSGYELFAREEPQVIDGSSFSEDPRPITSLKNFPLALGTFSLDDDAVDSKYCNYSLAIFPNGSKSTDEPIDYELEKCTAEHFDGFYIGTLDVNISDLYCTPKNIELNTLFVKFSLFSACVDLDGQFFAQQPYSAIVYPNYGLTLQNYTNPVQKYLDADEIYLKSGVIKNPIWNLQHSSVTTDDGWLVSNKQTEHQIQVANTVSKEIEFGAAGFSLMTYTFQISRKEISSSRSYKTIKTVLAEVGSAAQVVFTILIIFVTPYTKMKFSEAFVNELFAVERKKKQKATNKKRSKFKKNTNEHSNDKRPSTIELIKADNLQGFEPPKENNLFKKDDMMDKKEKFYSSLERLKSISQPKLAQYDYENPLLNINEEEKLPSAYKSEEKIISLRVPEVRHFENLAKPLQYDQNPVNQEKIPHSFSKPEINISSLQVPKVAQGDAQFEAILLGSPIHSQRSLLKSPEESIQNEAIKFEDMINRWELTNAPQKLSIEIKEREKDCEDSVARNDLTECKMSPISLEINEKGQFIQQEGDVEGSKKEIVKEDKTKFSDKIGFLGIITKSLQKPKKFKRPKIIRISIFEYMRSFIWRSESLGEKMDILNEGLVVLDNVLNIFVILRKIRDIDKIKSILFDKDQQLLFDQLSPPDIMNRMNHWYKEEYLSHDQTPKETKTQKEINIKEQITVSQKRIQNKPSKTEVDKRLSQLYEGINV